MNKKQILEQLKKKDYLQGVKSSELTFFHQLFDKIREYDYDGFVQSARQNGIDLGPVFTVLEAQATERLKTEACLRSYELYLLETMFPDPGQNQEASGPGTIQPLERGKIRKLYFALSAPGFGQNHVDRLKYYISEWGLKGLEQYAWQKGLLRYFNERYHELTDFPEGEYPIEEIIRKASLPELIEEEKLVEDFLFDEAEKSKRQDGIKDDLLLEQQGREKAETLLESLYALFDQSPVDPAKIRELMLKLHMKRRIETIEKNGLLHLREHLQKNWLEGATEVARRHNFNVPQSLDSGDSKWSMGIVNRSFLNQALQSGQGKVFLRREGMLAQAVPPQSARCFHLEGSYLLLTIAPFEQEEHFVFGLFPSAREQSLFLANFLEKYFQTGGTRQAAAQLVRHYLGIFSGQIRLGNAIKAGVFAFPVVIITALLVGLLYKLTVGNTGEALLLGGGIIMLGGAIAAKNGYSQKIRPEDQEQIPDYTMREKGVIKSMPLNSGKSQEKKK